MDLHQIGTALGDTSTTTGTGPASGSYPQHQQSTASSPSSSPSGRQHIQPFQQQPHQHHHHQQVYNLHPPPPQSYSPIITLPPISNASNSQYLDRNDEHIGSSSSWSRSRELQPQHHQHHHQHHQHQPHQLHLQQHHQQSNIKRESMGKVPEGHNGNGSSAGRNMDDSMPSTSDFVKKLYKMLEDPSFQGVVCWGPLGDCFVVKDMNEFTKSILPRMFKHSNFASFVRQLNKYDFHKVKNTDDNLFGEHSWTFRHPDFHADRREALENIKRKVPAQRKNVNIPNSTTTSLSSSTNNNHHHHHHHSSSSPSIHHNPHSHPHHSTTTSSPYPPNTINRRSPSPSLGYATPTPNSYHHHHHLSSSASASSSSSTHQLKQEITELKSRLLTLESTYETRLNNLETNYETRLNNLESSYESRLRGLEMGYDGRMRGLEKNYESVLVEMVSFQRGVAQQDGVVKSLIRCFLGGEGGESERDKLKATMTANRHFTTAMTTAGLLLPPSTTSVSMPSIVSSIRMEGDDNGLGQQQQQRQSQTPTSSLPFCQSQPLTSPHSLPLPQSQSQSQSQSQIGSPLPDRNLNVRWGNNNRPVFGDASRNGADVVDRFEGGPLSQQQQQPKINRQEALAQMMEYHRDRLVRSIGRENGGDERIIMDRGDGDRRGKRKRRGSDVEHTSSSATTQQQQQQQQMFRQPSTSSSPPTTSSSSSSSMNDNNNVPVPSFLPFGEDDSDSPSPSSSMMMNGNEGLRMYTVGHLMPRNTFVDDGSSGNWRFDTGGFSSGAAGAGVAGEGVPKDLGDFMYGPAVASEIMGSLPLLGGDRVDGEGEEEGIVRQRPQISPSPSTSLIPSSTTKSIPSNPSPSIPLPPAALPPSSSQKLRVRRATFVPGWAVPPRVLLVDDDAVIRKLSSKFLKIFGCTTDVAVDGIGAVTKMNLEKYDLVLMDILMPKLDGISATNLIRKFDRGTPIISMTVNSKPNEIMEYYSSGMNDILPKPFTKEGLLDMLEKHLMHLKVMQQMTVIPRSVGVPPLSDANFEQVLMTNAMMMQQQLQRPAVAGLLVGGNNNPSHALSTINSLSPPLLPLPLQHHHQPQQQQQLVLPPPQAQQQPSSQLSPTSLLGMGEDDGRINPLAGMGLSDEQYNMILQNLVNGERFMGMGMDAGGGSGMKRTIDDVGGGGDERGGKRSRFEVVD
ncbi:hypothetical protein BYT27DRAFT_7196034 [Phlegmacium glaucopus]|nr:hypothetical protein BYT27DRAFT_7196034 [Phlegmacium glaucopus]